MEYELAYYDAAVHRFNYYTTGTPPSNDHEIMANIISTGCDDVWGEI